MQLKNLIKEEHITQINSMMQVGSKYGMITLEDSLNSLVSRGVIDSRCIEKIFEKKSGSK